MKIIGVEAIPFAIPYTKPLAFASGEVRTADHVLIRVRTDEGLVGTAEAPPRPYTYGETQESSVAAVDKLFAPRLLGLTVLERETVHARLDRTVGNPTAKAALDMALWDLLGQAAGMPVSGLLGGFADRMRVSHMVGFAPAAEMVAEAERCRDTYGITTFKVKVGRRPYRDDVAACRALRGARGPGVGGGVGGDRARAGGAWGARVGAG
ncbi:mandelate racemase/muconate lactonizing enzyme family protein, partial [Streptomyces sp. NPDC058953]|uniref:mandelate racemase/muconate lactonizing enzyme family protein n=1 Tax=Streptomyces sp. NPDC058953 TaxID=3346676 RepID=UPI00367A4BFF